jgi:hypothetical protein
MGPETEETLCTIISLMPENFSVVTTSFYLVCTNTQLCNCHFQSYFQESPQSFSLLMDARTCSKEMLSLQNDHNKQTDYTTFLLLTAYYMQYIYNYILGCMI